MVEDMDFDVWTGETLDVTVDVTDPDGDPLPLAGYSVMWKLASPTPIVKTQDDGITVGATSFSFTLSEEDTAGLLTGDVIGNARYAHEAKIESPAGVVSVVLRGTVTVYRSLIEDVTPSV